MKSSALMLILVCLLKSFLMLELPSYMLGLLVSVNLLFILSLLLAPGLKMISVPLFMDMIKQKHKHTSVKYNLFFFSCFLVDQRIQWTNARNYQCRICILDI